MLNSPTFPMTSAVDAAALPGCWTLTPARAFSMQPPKAGVLRVRQGRVWLTLDGPHQGHANAWGDHVLQAGQSMLLRAGQRLVVEAWPQVAGEPVSFGWTPAPTAAAVLASRWRTLVLSPVREALRSAHSITRVLGR